MIYRNRIGALALATALLLVPFTPSVNTIVWAHMAQQEDVPSDAEQSLFTKGQNLYLQGHYDQAITVLRDFLKTYPNSIITDLTLLWLGRSYMQMGRWQEAEGVSQRLHAIHDTPFADVYDSELQTARQSAASRPAPTASSTPSSEVRNRTVNANTAARTNQPTQNSNARQPATMPSPQPMVAAARPTPTPYRPALNINRSTQAPQNTATTARNNQPIARPSPTPRLVASANTNSEIAPPAPEPTPRRVPRYTPRRGARRQTTPPSSITATQTTASVNANVRPQQVAVNTTPRTSTPLQRPTPVPQRSVAPSATTEPATVEPSTVQSGAGANFTVRQVPGLLLALRSNAESASPGQSVQIPLTVTNTGNKEDQFSIETDLPAEYQPSFSLAQGGTDTGLPILVTPQLARNASIDVVLNLRVPEIAADGQQRRFYVRATSQSDYRVMKVSDSSISVIAAALTAISDVSQASVMPDETFTQTISVRNNGTATARNARADFVFNPNFQLVSANPGTLAYDPPSRTAIWNLGDLSPRSTREITVTLRAMPNALAATNSLGRGAVRTQSLPLASNFDSPSITINKVPRARIDAVSVGLTVTPGDTIDIPFVVRNPGNTPDSYDLRITAPGAPNATIYADTNGDGQHQEGEPVITQTAQLEPQGGQFPVLLRVQVPSSTPDRQQFSYNMVARSLISSRAASEANTVLTVATPHVIVRTEQVAEAGAPGDTIFYRLVLINEGSGLAKNLVMTETLPDALQFVNSNPSLNPQDAPGNSQRFVWRVAELAPGDTTVLRITVRLRPNIPADTNLTTRHTLSYQDSNGTGYQGQ